MLTNPTLETLRSMRLYGMAQAYTEQTQQPEITTMSFDDRFAMIVDHEWSCRQDRRLARLLKEAKLKISACPEDIDYNRPRGLDRSVMRSLVTCDWIRQHHNALVSGPTGVGKTFVVCALAFAACRQGFSARYWRLSKLLFEISLARGDGSYGNLLNRLSRVDLLVIDDWGISPISEQETRDILDIVDDRSLTRSTIIASQLPLEEWYSSMADPSMAEAILDRLVHNAYKIVMKGESMRKPSTPLKVPDHSDT